MIVKLLIDFYRWLWGMPPLVTQTVTETVELVIFFSALIDISAIVGIIGSVITVYNNRKTAR